RRAARRRRRGVTCATAQEDPLRLRAPSWGVRAQPGGGLGPRDADVGAAAVVPPERQRVGTDEHAVRHRGAGAGPVCAAGPEAPSPAGTCWTTPPLLELAEQGIA